MLTYSEYKKLIDNHLLDYIPHVDFKARTLFESMRYSLLSGGKRIRPVMLIAACDFAGGDIYEALPVACALEYIHTYSLIHDDLPAMDDDDIRRGNPTNHKVYGEDIAILAGDGLLNTAMELMFRDLTYFFDSQDKLKNHIRASLMIAKSAGINGMIGGQLADVENHLKDCAEDMIDFIEANKTGALLVAPIVAGLEIAGADRKMIEDFTIYAKYIGKAFQISDDILDMTSSAEELGKTPGKDKTQEKANFALVNGMEKAKTKLHEFTTNAISAISNYEDAEHNFFTRLALMLENRRA